MDNERFGIGKDDTQAALKYCASLTCIVDVSDPPTYCGWCKLNGRIWPNDFLKTSGFLERGIQLFWTSLEGNYGNTPLSNMTDMSTGCWLNEF